MTRYPIQVSQDKSGLNARDLKGENIQKLFLKILKEKRLMLPPLSGYTDYPYRQILSLLKPPFITTEMVKARAVVEGNPKTLSMLRKEKGRHLKGSQLLGSDPDTMAKAAKKLENLGFDYVDINMGCTVRKIASKGEGISLMKNESLACAIVEKTVSSVKIPVTVKLRIGFSRENINVISFSEKLAWCGASSITIHGRTGEKKFASPVDIDIIREAASCLQVPVIANGGIFSGDDALRILKETKASAVMPGRAILGNPWIITDILWTLQGKVFTPPGLEEKKKMFWKHFSYLSCCYGEKSSLFKIRKILPWYFSSCQNLKSLRKDAHSIKDKADIKKILRKLTEKKGSAAYI
ncbi:MAG: tRNA-dihydrouridine synthase [Candidatus Aureabacteria bacterium]|nr:tRNA-dihydrouridine synthase [Candidatus Auribacterota bacterium]